MSYGAPAPIPDHKDPEFWYTSMQHRNPTRDSSKLTSSFRLMSIAELLEKPIPPTEYLVDGLLPIGGASVLCAEPKVGKTVLVRNLALAVAKGEEFLGRRTVQGPVVLLALEEKLGEVRRHFEELGVEGNEPIYIHCASAPQNAVSALASIVAETKPALVVVDTMFKLIRPKDGNDYATMTLALEPVMDVARTTGAHILCTHHAKKGEFKVDGDSILGSQAIFAWGDTIMLMRRTRSCRYISSIQRYGDDMPETILEFDPASRRVTLGSTRSANDERRIEEEIEDLLEKSGEEFLEEQLLKRVTGRTGSKRAALRELVSQGRITQNGRGVRGDPYVYRSNSRSI